MLENNLNAMATHHPTSADGWRARVKEAWAAIPQTTINKLVADVKQRLVGVVEKEGQWLFPHKTK